MCTSPAEIMVVTPPCRLDSIQPSWFWRGVQSPATGWTWLSIKPGARAVPWASIVVEAPDVSRSAWRPIAAIRPSTETTVSASRIGLAISPDKRSPMLRMTSLPVPPPDAASWCAMAFPSKVREVAIADMPPPRLRRGQSQGRAGNLSASASRQTKRAELSPRPLRSRMVDGLRSPCRPCRRRPASPGRRTCPSALRRPSLPW